MLHRATRMPAGKNRLNERKAPPSLNSKLRKGDLAKRLPVSLYRFFLENLYMTNNYWVLPPAASPPGTLGKRPRCLSYRRCSDEKTVGVVRTYGRRLCSNPID